VSDGSRELRVSAGEYISPGYFRPHGRPPRNPRPGRVLERLVEDGHRLACSAITVAEVIAGMRPKEREATVALLDSLEHHDITRPVAERAGLLRRGVVGAGQDNRTPRSPHRFHRPDPRSDLCDDNARDFPMKELQLHSFG
jgi:hypothetical protein